MSHKVLVVDDESMIADSIGRILQRKGFDVKVAYNGLEALSVLQDSEFDLIIADLLMGNVGGEEVLEHVKAKHPSCPVIIMTAYGDAEIHEKLLNSGASRVLTKPFDDIMMFPDLARETISGKN